MEFDRKPDWNSDDLDHSCHLIVAPHKAPLLKSDTHREYTSVLLFVIRLLVLLLVLLAGLLDLLMVTAAG